MLQVPVYGRGVPFRIDETLAANLTWWRNAVINQDMDCVFFVDGKEGSGKSLTLAPQIGAFLDIERRMEIRDQYFWDLDLFIKAVMSSPKGRCLILDEAGRYLDRREHAAKSNIKVRKLLWECRRRNLFLGFCMPSFYDADMGVAVHRTRFLVHASYRFRTEEADHELGLIPQKPLERGHAIFYTEEGKKTLYQNDRLRERYAYPFIQDESFRFHVPEHYVFPKEDYKAMRDAAEDAFFGGKELPECPECGKSPVRAKRSGELVCALNHAWKPEASA